MKKLLAMSHTKKNKIINNEKAIDGINKFNIKITDEQNKIFDFLVENLQINKNIIKRYSQKILDIYNGIQNDISNSHFSNFGIIVQQLLIHIQQSSINQHFIKQYLNEDFVDNIHYSIHPIYKLKKKTIEILEKDFNCEIKIKNVILDKHAVKISMK